MITKRIGRHFTQKAIFACPSASSGRTAAWYVYLYCLYVGYFRLARRNNVYTIRNTWFTSVQFITYYGFAYILLIR